MDKTPESWRDITISQYDDIMIALETENKIERDYLILAILHNVGVKDIKKLPISTVNEMMSKLKFLDTKPNNDFNKIIEIDGIRYGFITDTSEISYPEYIDLDMNSMNWEDGKHKLMSILYRRIIKEDNLGYYIEEYDPKVANQIADIFYNRASYQDLYGVHLFFSIFVIELLRISPQFLTQLNQT